MRATVTGARGEGERSGEKEGWGGPICRPVVQHGLTFSYATPIAPYKDAISAGPGMRDTDTPFFWLAARRASCEACELANAE